MSAMHHRRIGTAGLAIATAALAAAAGGLAAGSADPASGTIAFVSPYRVDAWDGIVFERRPDGVTRRIAGENAVASPDGSRVAIIEKKASQTALVVTDRAGGGRKALLRWPGDEGASVVWSPDGSRIVAIVGSGANRHGEEVLSRPGRAYLLTASGRVLALRRAWRASWSSDAARFVLQRRESAEIRDGRGRRVARFDGASDAAWSADGSRIAYVLERPSRVVVADRRGRTVMVIKARLPDMQASVSWSAAGRRLAVELFYDGTMERWLVGADGSRRLVPSTPRLGWNGARLLTAPVWLERAMRQSGDTTELSPDRRTVYRPDGFYTLEGGRKLRGSPHVDAADAYGWSPDARWYLIREERQLVALAVPGFSRRLIRRLPPDTSLAWARWEPDGRVRYALTTTTFPRLHVLDVARGSTGAIVEIDPTGQPSYDHPVWSPDGKRLLAVRADTRGDGKSWLVVLEPGRARERRLGESSGRPAWTPDGSSAVIVRRTDIVLRSLADGSDRVVATVAGATSASMSPDGARLAVTTPRELRVLALAKPEEQAVVVTFPPRGSRTPGPRNPTWSPDGREIAYAGPTGLEVVVADGSSPPRQLVAPAERPSSPTWTASGGAIVFAARDPDCTDRLRLLTVPAAGGPTTHLFRMPRCSGSTAPTWRP